jgi:hypothetical protein
MPGGPPPPGIADHRNRDRKYPTISTGEWGYIDFWDSVHRM